MDRDTLRDIDHYLILIAGLWLVSKIITYTELWRLGNTTSKKFRSPISRAAGNLFLSLVIANIPFCIILLLRFVSGPDRPLDPIWLAFSLRVWWIVGLGWNFWTEIRLIRVTRAWLAQGGTV